jgi:DNA-directed RNA polymerase specialized sigma24 family protein
VPTELAGQRPLLERAATGDREAFALLYDTQVTGVYRYLLAWTGSPAEAADLTAQVFHSATGWLPTTTGPEGEASAWLTAMSRDALAQRQAGAGPGGGEVAAGDMVAAVTRLRDPEREVAILRLLLGHSLDHTAHLSGYSHRAAMELQLAACLAIHEVTGGPPPGDDALSGLPGTAASGALMGGDLPGRARAATPPEAHAAASAEKFERRLGLREVDLTGSDPALAGALTAASALRRAAPEHVADPPSELVQRLRRELVTAPGAVSSREHLPAGSATFPSGGLNNRGARIRVPQLHLRRRRPRIRPLRSSPLRRRSRGCAPVPTPPLEVAGLGVVPLSDPPEAAGSGPATRARRSAGPWWGDRGVGGWLGRRPWVATAVATTGIVVVLTLQAFGGSGQPTACAGPDCAAPTTRAVAAGGGRSVGTPLTTQKESSTTSSTLAADPVVAPSSAVPRTSAATVPPSTRPPTTAPPTTAAPRPTTTTAPTTTAPPTTASTTTTTVAPAPT